MARETATRSGSLPRAASARPAAGDARARRAPIERMSQRSIPITPAAPQDPAQPALPLSPAQRRTLRAAAALVIPASAEFGVPGADDEAIATDIERTLGPDRAAVLRALDKLDAAAGGPLAEQTPTQREAAGRWLREHEPALATTFAGLVAACYYRDDRVMRSLGLEPRAPYPLGYTVEPGDFEGLLAPVRARGRVWREAR
jgi:hypothetical protein